MSVVKELIRQELSGALSFGNYELDQKTKVNEFEHQGDLYKVKTFREITKLERNGMFVYESVPGTAVLDFELNDWGMEFRVEGSEPAQITLGLEPDEEYRVFVNDTNIGKMPTILGGKLVLSLELEEGKPALIKVIK